jgi:transposase
VRQKRSFSPEFRREAVELYRSTDRSLDEVATELGIASSTLQRWNARSAVEGREREEGAGDDRAELRRLRRENRRLREEREILKKAAAFFVKESETR